MEIEGSETAAPAPASPPRSKRGQKTIDILASNLSRTYAADAPSHRAAWRQIQDKILHAPSDSDEDDESVPSTSSAEPLKGNMAMSMPVDIVMPKHRVIAKGKSNGPRLERKTSLTEKRGIMVPPLRAAMRPDNTLGLSMDGTAGPRNGDGQGEGQRGVASRSKSVSREREEEQMREFNGDPGAALELLAKTGEDEGDERDAKGVDDGVVPGTLVERKGFVPPHVLARRVSAQVDVGWRSMAD
jgi:hypothetical protein